MHGDNTRKILVGRIISIGSPIYPPGWDPLENTIIMCEVCGWDVKVADGNAYASKASVSKVFVGHARRCNVNATLNGIPHSHKPSKKGGK